MKRLIVKSGEELTRSEIDQINRAKAREFKASPLQAKVLKTTQFFLLLDGDTILALGKLIPVEPVVFNGETFSILGIGGILSNEKDKGYGKQIMTAIKDYLISKNKTGVGFFGPQNRVFYEKCGFNVDTTSSVRFIFKKDGKEINDPDGSCVLYLDASDNFMKKVLSNPSEKVILPRPPNW